MDHQMRFDGMLHPELLALDARCSNLKLTGNEIDLKSSFKPNPFIYWVDFLASAVGGTALVYISATFPPLSPAQIALVFLAAAIIFRACLFMHEAVHCARAIPGFVAAYNLLFGFVHKIPLYIYWPHRFHHANEMYGTMLDPEYELLRKDRGNVFAPLLIMAVIPLALLVRFGIVPALLPFIGARGRNAVYQYASTFALNRHYKRPLPSPEERREWYRQDAGCFLYNAVFFGLFLAGIWSWNLLLSWYLVAYLTLLFNHYRVMTSHTYMSGFQTTTRKQQILDSLNVDGQWWMGWLYPLGLRYHALHHLMPNVPYHQMAGLHKKLMAGLPADHPYRATVEHGFWAAVNRLPG